MPNNGTVHNLSHMPNIKALVHLIRGTDLLPVNVRKVIIGQGLMDGLLDEIGGLAHPAGSQLVDDGLGLFICCIPALLRVNGFELGLEHFDFEGIKDEVLSGVANQISRPSLNGGCRRMRSVDGRGHELSHAARTALASQLLRSYGLSLLASGVALRQSHANNIGQRGGVAFAKEPGRFLHTPIEQRDR